MSVALFVIWFKMKLISPSRHTSTKKRLASLHRGTVTRHQLLPGRDMRPRRCMPTTRAGPLTGASDLGGSSKSHRSYTCTRCLVRICLPCIPRYAGI